MSARVPTEPAATPSESPTAAQSERALVKGDKRRFRITVAVVALGCVLSVAGVAAYIEWPRHAPMGERFHTMVVARGDVVSNVAGEPEVVRDALRVLDGALDFHPPGAAKGDGDAVWVVSKRGPRRVPIVAGIGDGVFTAVEGDLHEGDTVIVALTDAGAQAYGSD